MSVVKFSAPFWVREEARTVTWKVVQRADSWTAEYEYEAGNRTRIACGVEPPDQKPSPDASHNESIQD